MIISLLAGVLASSVMTTSLPAEQISVPHYSFGPVLAQESFTTYIVQKGDYLSMIAESYYGNEDYWTNIWNDNPQVEDAAQLEPGTELKIRKVKTTEPEILKPEFADRVPKESPAITYKYAPAVNNAAVSAQARPVVSQAVSSVPGVLSDAQINALGSCEAGMNPSKNTGNGYYGAFQFSQGTWNSMNTGYARADLAPIDVQKAAVQRLVARSSVYTQFPACSRRM